MRMIYYFLKACFQKMFLQKNIAFSTMIAPKTILEEHVKIGRNTYFKGYLSNYSYIGENCRIKAKIGKFCSISHNVKTISGTHPLNFLSTSPVFFSKTSHFGKSNIRILKKHFEFEEVKENDCLIGNDVWIGENVLIKSGIKIGNGAVIGMGSVVVKNVKDYEIVGGAPAKHIRYRFNENIRNKLNEICWWNFSEKELEKFVELNLDLFLSEVIL